MITFITGNKNKFEEISAVISSDLQISDIDLEEIQELDAHVIIEHKIGQARAQVTGPILIEDTSLYFEGLNNFPGPLIKWFLQSLGCQGIYNLVQSTGNFKATAKTILGYDDGLDNVKFFEGTCNGSISEPKVESAFGWDPIFVPSGYNISFAEMDKELKRSISMRTNAVKELNNFLQS